MSIEQKIAELLEESAKLKLMEETTEEEIEVVEELSEEEFAQLDEDEQDLFELSKATLGSYVKKAGSDRSGAGFRAGMAAAQGKDSPYNYDANMKIAVKREKGIGKAVDKMTKEDIDVQEDVDALLFGEDLTEEFKVKAATIFEAAVMARVNAEVETLEEAFEARLVEQAILDKEEIIEKVDGYLGYVVEQWMSDNEIAIENGLKSDILEGFVDGLKTLFVEHYIEVPEERFDVVGDLQEQVDFLESKLDESLEQNVQMMKELNEKTRDAVTGDFCSDMTDTEVEKFTALAEELSYEDADNFASKLQIIKENYFGKKPLTLVESVVTDSPVQLNEETKHIDAGVARYLETFNRIK
jgi:hypothetical protein